MDAIRALAQERAQEIREAQRDCAEARALIFSSDGSFDEEAFAVYVELRECTHALYTTSLLADLA